MKIFLPVFLAAFLAILAAAGVLYWTYSVKQDAEAKREAARVEREAARVELELRRDIFRGVFDRRVKEMAEWRYTADAGGWPDSYTDHMMAEIKASVDEVLLCTNYVADADKFPAYIADVRTILIWFRKLKPNSTAWADQIEQTLKAIDAIRDHG